MHAAPTAATRSVHRLRCHRPGVSPGGRLSLGDRAASVVIWEDVANDHRPGSGQHERWRVLRHCIDPYRAGSQSGVAVTNWRRRDYAAYSISEESLRLRRSLDDGANWEPAVRITDRAFLPGISLTAAGDDAFVGFTTLSNDPSAFFRARYRSTGNGGANWSSVQDLSPNSAWTTYDPDLALQGGVLRAVFTRCTPEFDVCVNERTFYRQMPLGSGWSGAERASPNSLFEARVPHVAYADKILVFYLGDFQPFVRAGTP